MQGFCQLKAFAGYFLLVDTIVIPFLEPLLAKLPKCMRVGPLASPQRYSARDFVVTNLLMTMILVGFLQFACKSAGLDLSTYGFDHLASLPLLRANPEVGGSPRCSADKYLLVCGWSPDGFPWNIRDATGASVLNCDLMGPMLTDTGGNAWQAPVGVTAIMPCFILCLARKLPRWGEPPLPEEAESATAIATPPATAKV